MNNLVQSGLRNLVLCLLSGSKPRRSLIKLALEAHREKHSKEKGLGEGFQVFYKFLIIGMNTRTVSNQLIRTNCFSKRFQVVRIRKISKYSELPVFLKSFMFWKIFELLKLEHYEMIRRISNCDIL